MMNMITAVVIVDGRCRFIKLHELSTEVVFLICSTNFALSSSFNLALENAFFLSACFLVILFSTLKR